MRRLSLLGAVLALAVAVAAFAAFGLVTSGATEAYIITKFEPKKIEMNRDMFDEKAPNESWDDYKFRVMGIYGGRVDYLTPVVFVPPERFEHPKEMPSLTLLPVDLEKGWTPVQVKTIWFITKKVVAVAIVAFVVLVALYFVLSGKPDKGQPPPA